MSLTKTFLKGLGVTEDQITAIMEGHLDSINVLREERDKYKQDAEKLPDVQKKLDKAEKDLELANGWKEKYEKEHSDFEDFKTATTEKENNESKKTLYRAMLKEANIADDWVDRILKVTDFSEFKLKDGKLDNEEEIKKSIETEYAGYVKTTKKGGAKVENPPKGNDGESADDNSEYIKKKVAEHNATFFGITGDKGEKN